ncbi:hypothetical protein LZC95_19795 [Pendulispora brunnea]|uniref:Uncharacterized protein n=1 Tax=Pendulispora brunnea TaxID=2905690 RepID=A0ABZ2KMZ8_9BACT
MLFVGAIPRPFAEQALRVFDLQGSTEVFVCCSGSFRFEQGLMARSPDAVVHSNDVSLLSCAIGSLATGEPLAYHFKNDLEFLEEAVCGGSPLERLAALSLAVRMSHFHGASDHARRHREHFRVNVGYYLGLSKDRVAKYMETIRVRHFFAGDFRDHAAQAVQKGATLFAWPPTYRGGYERLYKFVDQNTEWSPPSYRVFDPKDLEGWVSTLRELGARFAVCADQRLEGLRPVGMYSAGRSKPLYLYASSGRNPSLRKRPETSDAIRYEPCDPCKLTETSRVTVALADNRVMNALKDKYLLAGLVHVTGQMGFVVFLDGALAGGYLYSDLRSLSGFRDPRLQRNTGIYLLSDFAVSRKRRLSKLVCMLASGQESVDVYDRRRLQRTVALVTTAFTERPVSMKYRGVFDLLTRRPGVLNYISEVRRADNQAIYREWWRRYALHPDRPATGSLAAES